MITARTIQPLRAGAASVDITPPVGIRMQGYQARRAEAISDRLLVSTLAVGSGSVEWLLVSVDCIGLDRSFTAPVRETLARLLSMPLSAITIACSHTHSGPATLQHLGVVEGEESYLIFLKQQLTFAARTAVNRMEEVRWRFGSTSLPENINRRVRTRGRIELGADPRGPVDSRLRVLRIDRAGEHSRPSVLALIVHYACHATSSAGVPHISADWPGVMRSMLQTVYGGEEVPVVCFLQGCTGDVTHRIARDRHSWPEHFEQHTAVQCDILGRLSAAAAVTACERSVGLRAETVDAVLQPLSLSYHRHLAFEETEAQVVRIGPVSSGDASAAEQSIWILALPGEPFATYSTGLGDRLKRQVGVPKNNVWVCGYTNDAVGYLCTRQALREGGYEAWQAHELYHRPAPFSAATQALVFDRLSQAAVQLVNRNLQASTSGVGSSLKRLRQRLFMRP